jgi:hypothetical protein
MLANRKSLMEKIKAEMPLCCRKIIDSEFQQVVKFQHGILKLRRVRDTVLRGSRVGVWRRRDGREVGSRD